METQPFDQSRSTAHEQEIIAWLRQNSFPIEHIEPGNGFADLQPLKAILKDAKVVGLGEATHGTREFFLFKHRLVEFLVKVMNFTSFTIEASFTACQPINEYILYGKGERANVLTGQGYVPWDTEEFSSLLDWMREYNRSVSGEKRVKFYGLDLWRNNYGRGEVLTYLRKFDLDCLPAVEVLFNVLSEQEMRWPTKIDEETKKTLVQILPQLQKLIDHLTVNKKKFVRSSSVDLYAQILQYTRVMEQWLLANAADLLPELHPGDRSTYMAENLSYLIEKAKPDEKFIYWAHNYHIGVGDKNEPNFGQCLREKYGSQYFAFGFETGGGSYRARTSLPDKLLGDLMEITISQAPEGSLPWFLSRVNGGDLILDLHAPVSDPIVQAWIQSPMTVQSANWISEGMDHYDMNISGRYDCLIFIKQTTATRPTINALKTVSNRMWL